MAGVSGSGEIDSTPLEFSTPPRRVVSLVPSITESLFDLGLGSAVAAVTDYCTRPPNRVSGLPRVGGTQDPRTADILAQNPDLVIACREENPLQVVEALQRAGVPVLVVFPKSAQQAMEMLWGLAGIFRSDEAGARLQVLQRALDWAGYAAADRIAKRTFCPIWQESGQYGTWWMTFNQDTYPHDLLSLLGGENVFAERERRYPLEADLGMGQPEPAGERDTRYPRVTREEILAAAPEVILLPDEPYRFSAAERDNLLKELADTPAAQTQRVHLLDGSLITWYGTRLGKALTELADLFE